MAKKKRNVLRRKDFPSQQAYEDARRLRIIQLKRKRRRQRQIAKAVIISIMALIVVGVGYGAYRGVSALFGLLTTKNIESTILAERHETVAAAGTAVVKETETPQLDLLVCVDPGHGGEDGGAGGSGVVKHLEKNDVLELGRKVRDALEDMGAKVIMTRDDDTKIELAERAYIANDAGADYFVSIHRNSAGEGDVYTDAQGVEIFCKSSSDESLRLGQNIMDQLKLVGISEDRKAKPGSRTSETSDFQVNRDTDMPSVLIEMGFMTNKEDNELFEKNMDDYAKAIAQGVVDMLEKEPAETGRPKGITLDNRKVSDVDQLDDTLAVWAPGPKKDDTTSVPTGVTNAQEELGGYGAMFIGDTSAQEITLTFDVGSNSDYVGQILDALEEAGVKAVFFINNSFASQQKELVGRMIEQGHMIGYRPSDLETEFAEMSEDDQSAQLETFSQRMLLDYNYNTCLFRYFNGRYTVRSLARVNNSNFRSVFWSFSYEDYMDRQPDSEKAVNAMADYLHNGAIYGLNTSRINADILPQFLDLMGQKGYHAVLPGL